jgi:hypothetical protein
VLRITAFVWHCACAPASRVRISGWLFTVQALYTGVAPTWRVTLERLNTMTSYSNLVSIVQAGMRAHGLHGEASGDERPANDLHAALLAFAAALDIIEARSGGTEQEAIDPEQVMRAEAVPVAPAEPGTHYLWHPDNTEHTLDEAARFAEHFYTND